jgi:hypothetical protein
MVKRRKKNKLGTTLPDSLTGVATLRPHISFTSSLRPIKKFQTIFQNGVPHFKCQTLSATSPRLPRNPPRFHHDLPSRNTPKTQKPPTKTTFSPPKLFCAQKPEK